MQHRRYRRAGAIALTVVMVAAAGCGDDDDEASGGDVEAYCDLARELDAQEDFPSAEQLEDLRDAAPEEIEENIDTVVDAFLAAIEEGDPASAFGDPEVEENFGPIEEFEASECGIGGDEEEDEGAEQDPSVTEIDPAAARVDVSATEYAFEFEAPAAGRVSFVMTNDGEETHLMAISRLAEGATLDEALQAEDPEAEGLLDETFTDLESDTAEPGGEAVLTGDLEPGTYAMICYLPNSEGEPHLALGMAEEFTVS
jgi:uncharacterized cupredoxin-like copper-binding protein